jgi:hypothetical protein
MSTGPLEGAADHVAVCDGSLGVGLHACRPFHPGEPILEFTGPIVTFQQVIAMGEEQAYVVQIGPDRYIDTEPPGRFTNHSCAPNAGVVTDSVLVAVKPIMAGEEIRFDYSTTMSENYWTLACRCGEANCRGVIRDFHLLPATFQEHYIRSGLVQEFIVREREERECRADELELLLGASVRPRHRGAFPRPRWPEMQPGLDSDRRP